MEASYFYEKISKKQKMPEMVHENISSLSINESGYISTSDCPPGSPVCSVWGDYRVVKYFPTFELPEYFLAVTELSLVSDCAGGTPVLSLSLGDFKSGIDISHVLHSN